MPRASRRVRASKGIHRPASSGNVLARCQGYTHRMATLSSPSGHAAPLTRAEYEELVRRGVFEDSRVELLYGRVSPMSPSAGSTSTACASSCACWTEPSVTKGWSSTRLPSLPRTSRNSIPNVFVASPGDYLDESPRSAMLVIEVADSSLRFDRRTKAVLYAKSNVPGNT